MRNLIKICNRLRHKNYQIWWIRWSNCKCSNMPSNLSKKSWKWISLHLNHNTQTRNLQVMLFNHQIILYCMNRFLKIQTLLEREHINIFPQLIILNNIQRSNSAIVLDHLTLTLQLKMQSNHQQLQTTKKSLKRAANL
jgi:hypothetical protein